MKSLALVALFSLTGCVQWWVASSDNPSPQQTPPTVTVQPITSQVVAVEPPVVEPSAVPVVATSEPIAQPTAEPTIAPIPSSAPQLALNPAPAPAVVSAPIGTAAVGTSCASLNQLMTTSFGRLTCSYSDWFTGNTFAHHTIAELVAAGATVLPQQIANNYWAQPKLDYGSGGGAPMYVATSASPAYTFVCRAYGICDASGMLAHFPAGAAPSPDSDHHIELFDTVFLHGEIDAWGGLGGGCALGGGIANCSWGGIFPFDGDGRATGGSSGNAAGIAVGLFAITAPEILSGHISHMLGIEQNCVDDGAVWPAIVGRASDHHCPANIEPNVRYGYVIALKPTVDIASLGYSGPCVTILTALRNRGAVTIDVAGGISLLTESTKLYPAGNNPWTNMIEPALRANGDASCVSRVPAADIEVLQLNPTLPPMSVAVQQPQ